MAAARIRQTKCPECSASLDVDPTAETMKCAYCGTPLQIENKRPPRDPALTAPRTVYVPTGPPPAARLAMLIGPLLPIVIVGTQFWPQLRGFLPVVGNQLPVTCGLNGHVSISGKQWSGTGAAIKAETNCTITIKDSKLEADTIVEGGLNVTVVVEGSTLVARKRAIVAEHNAKVRVVGKSEIRGERAALDLGLNAEVHLEDSALRSKGTALKADGNLRLEAEGGELEGATAIDASGWAQRYEVAGTKITGAKKLKVNR